MIKVGVIVGSLRKGSYSKMVAHAFEELASENMRFEHIEYGDVPHFSQDLEDNPPAEWVRLREQIRGVDALLFVTPEYNRSFPGSLKNALDVASRPYGHSVWNGKPGAVISTSIGKIGGFGANHHLRQVLSYLNVPTLDAPEAYVGEIAAAFDDDGKLINEDTNAFLKSIVDAYEKWVALHVKAA